MKEKDALTELGTHYNTDKAHPHYYTSFYHKHLKGRREDVTSLLEIGIDQGSSLRMWRDYFLNAEIYGIDIYEENLFSEDRINTFKIAQEDTEALDKEFSSIKFDVILDDGGHTPQSQIDGFLHMKKFLKPKGVYIIEDLHTSYIPWHGGGVVNADQYFRKLSLEEHGAESIEFYSNLDKKAKVECITGLIKFKN